MPGESEQPVILIRLRREPEVNADPARRRPGAGPAFLRAEFGGPDPMARRGAGWPAGRWLVHAVQWTVPFELNMFERGHHLVCAARARRRRMTSHPDRAHGYTTTTEASDALAVTFRRVIIAARFRGPCPDRVTAQETRAVPTDWACRRT
jgi:hypothetical protein